MWEVKYKGNRSLTTLCGHLLYEELFHIIEETITFNRAQKIILVPIPMSKQRLRDRGWNQAELLCRAMLSAGGASIAEYRADILERIIHTERQTLLKGHARRKNIEHTMRATPTEELKGSVVVLVDDVATTGSTFKEAVRALTEAGAWKVHCLAFAH